MKTTHKSRKLKIYDKYRHRKCRRGGFVPQIILQGNWLQEAGFAIGQAVEITVTDGRLVICTVL